jgi:exonuclease SbcC
VIIKKIELENFKSHVNTQVDFDTGISIIMGDNGAGKSSILESISFGLFKEYASKKMDKLINNDKNKMQVTVEFIANGRTYKVVRKRKRNSSPESMLYIEDDGRFSVIEKGDAAVSEEIEKIIDLDKNLFLNAVYVRQGEIANLITKNPSEKKEMMGRLLGVDELESSWKNMKFVIDDYKKEEVRINGKLENLGNVEEDLKNKEKKKDELYLLFNEKELGLKNTEEKVLKLKRVKEFFDQKEIDFNKISQKIEHDKLMLNKLNSTMNELSNQINEISLKESQIEGMKPEISKITILEGLKDKILNLRELEMDAKHIEKSLKKIEFFKNIISDTKEFHDKFLTLEAQIIELTNSRKEFEGSDILKNNFEINIKNLSMELEKLEKSISIKLEDYGEVLEEETGSITELESILETKRHEIKENIKQNQEQVNGFNSKISDLKGQNKEILKAVGELENAEDTCPVCESDLEESRREELLEKYKSQIEKNNNEIFSFEDNLRIWKSERKFLEEKNVTLNKIIIDVLKKDSKDLKKKSNEIDEFKFKLIEIEKSVKNLEDIDLILSEKRTLKDELRDNYQKFLGAENSLKAMEDPVELLNSFNDIKKGIQPLKSGIIGICAEIDVEEEEVSSELENLRILKSNFDRLNGEVKSKEEVLKSLSRVKDEIATASSELEDDEVKIAAIGYESKKHDLVRDDLEICQKEFDALQKQVGSIKGQLDGIVERLDELKAEVEFLIKDKKELQKIGRFIELLNEIRSLYGKDGLQKDLRNKSRPLIEKNTLDFFNKFNFEYSDIKLNEDYDVTLFGPSGENTLDMISGGEIIAAAIALRLGIAKTLVKGNLELMILDEPTVHLDSYRRHELIDVIKKLSVIPQMIIVTHDSGLEEAADNILKIEKENGRSGLVNV